jgi:hypothetical protein
MVELQVPDRMAVLPVEMVVVMAAVMALLVVPQAEAQAVELAQMAGIPVLVPLVGKQVVVLLTAPEAQVVQQMVAQVTAELMTEAVVMALDQLEVQVTAVVLVLAMDLLPELTELTGEQLTVPDQDQLEALQMAVALTVLEARAVVQLVVQLAVQAQAVEAAVALVETRVAAEQSQKQT